MKIKNEVRDLIIPHALEASVWLTSSLGGVILGTAIGRIASGYEAVSSLILGLFFILLCVGLTTYRVMWLLKKRKDIRIKIRKRRTKKQMELDEKIAKETESAGKTGT